MEETELFAEKDDRNERKSGSGNGGEGKSERKVFFRRVSAE